MILLRRHLGHMGRGGRKGQANSTIQRNYILGGGLKSSSELVTHLLTRKSQPKYVKIFAKKIKFYKSNSFQGNARNYISGQTRHNWLDLKVHITQANNKIEAMSFFV